MRRRLLIDCQLLQSRALHRGMGKYTLSILDQLRRMQTPYDEIEIILNKAKIDRADTAILKDALKGYKVVKLDLKKADHGNPGSYEERIIQTNKSIIDEYIARSSSESDQTDFMIASLFQENECPVFPDASDNKLLLIYDIIPLQFPDYYLTEQHSRYLYLSRYRVFFEATKFFTISTTVANDLSLQLGIPREKITPIHGSYIERAALEPIRPKSVGPKEKYILMPTGDDVRKNNVRATAAFNDFNAKTGYEYKLVITSFFGEKTKNELLLNSDHIIFTDNVNEGELAWLYKKASAVLFVSEYEGLGMPPLEALEFKKPVICSDIDVFRELSQKAFHFCDPYDVNDISTVLQKVLLAKETRLDLAERKRLMEEFSWSNTTKKLVGGLPGLSVGNLNQHKRKRIAVFAPESSGYSAIGKVVQEQHYELSRFADVDYYLESGISDKAAQSSLRVNYLPYVASVRAPWSFTEKIAQSYDEIIFHVGNSEYHIASVMMALAYEGTLVLHDTRLGELFDLLQTQSYISEERLLIERRLEEALAGLVGLKAFEDSKCISSLVSRANRIIVHSDYAKLAVEKLLPGYENKVVRENLPTPSPYAIYERSIQEVVTLGYAGILHAAKGLSEVSGLTAHKFTKPIEVKLFGFSLVSPETAEELSFNPAVSLVLSPSDTRFTHELELCDVVIGFRPDYHGESSLSALEALRLGKRIIVNNQGWFKELPGDLVTNIDKISMVKDAVAEYVENPDSFEKSLARLEYIREHHSISKYVSVLSGGGRDLV